MTRDEMKTLMGLINAVYPHWEVSAPLIDIWHQILGNWDGRQVQQAVREYLAENHDFPPKPGQINAICEKGSLPKELTIEATEALLGAEHQSLLSQDATAFANKVAKWDVHRQYGSPEELQKAGEIHQAIWKREFKDRFETKQDTALSKIRQGMTPDIAIALTIAESGLIELPEAAKKLLLEHLKPSIKEITTQPRPNLNV